jgi:hypothetical protein
LAENYEADGFEKICNCNLDCCLAALFSVGWSEQRGISLSVESAQARTRLYVHLYYYNPYRADLSGVCWYAVRAYYEGGSWSGDTPGGGGPWAYSGWDDYAQRNGIGCVPGTLVKGGDGMITSANKPTRDKEVVQTATSFNLRLPSREIARRVRAAPSTLRLTISRFEASGLTWPLPDDVTDTVLEARLFAKAGSGGRQGQRRLAQPD